MEKRKIFSLALKDDRAEQCLRSCGSEFQMWGPKQRLRKCESQESCVCIAGFSYKYAVSPFLLWVWFSVEPRAYHACVALGRMIYVMGGFNGMEYFNSCRKFNPVAMTWSEAPPMNSKR